MNRPEILRRRIRWLTWIFIAGLVLSGATAIPLEAEMNWITRWFDPGTEIGHWLGRVRQALNESYAKYPFLAYGTDWLAFGHFMIAVALLGALRDPVRNVWLYDFAMIACVLVVPYALVFGAVREIPLGWRLIDCTFGAGGIIPVWLCRKWTGELESCRPVEDSGRK